DSGLRNKPIPRFNRVPDVYQGNFRSYFAHIVAPYLIISKKDGATNAKNPPGLRPCGGFPASYLGFLPIPKKIC
ncbi:MAG: hypothetical protein LBJ90_07245, partial [Treponema sp.]|nr:hypothetical protein [Treponema sp.]